MEIKQDNNISCACNTWLR